MQDIDNNLNNNEFKTTIDKKTYDFKNAKKFLVKITTKKISEKEALELYSDLITPDIIKLRNAKSKGKNKRNNILNVLENLESVFKGNYFHYKYEPSELESKSDSEESIAERTKLRRPKSAEQPNEQPDTTDMPELESEVSAEQRRNQQGQGLKILTPDQMLSRLSISLAQIKAGNNSEKLKNEIR